MGREIFVIGDKEVVDAFKLIGVKGLEVRSPKELLNALRKVVVKPENVGVILVSEDYIDPVKEEVERIQLNLGGSLIIGRLPGRVKRGSSLNVHEILKKALGVG